MFRGNTPYGDPVGAPAVQLVVVDDVSLGLPGHPFGVSVVVRQYALLEVILELGDPAACFVSQG